MNRSVSSRYSGSPSPRFSPFTRPSTIERSRLNGAVDEMRMFLIPSQVMILGESHPISFHGRADILLEVLGTATVCSGSLARRQSAPLPASNRHRQGRIPPGPRRQHPGGLPRFRRQDTTSRSCNNEGASLVQSFRCLESRSEHGSMPGHGSPNFKPSADPSVQPSPPHLAPQKGPRGDASVYLDRNWPDPARSRRKL
jgi:hypothetical protein